MDKLYRIYYQVYSNISKLLNDTHFVNVCQDNKDFIIKLINNRYTAKEAYVVCITFYLYCYLV